MGLLSPLHRVDTIIAWVVAIDRNQWSRSTGMPGRVRLESVVAIDRKTHFRAALAKNGSLSDHPLDRRNALELIYRRAKQAGIATQIGCHTFRATGITIYLTNGGTLEKAQTMAAHESPRTTKLYDRTSDAVSLDEVERVVF